MDDAILDILIEMARIPAVAKAWRTTVNDVFADARFFDMAPSSSEKWRPLIRAMIDTDRQAFPELIGLCYSNPFQRARTSECCL